MKRKVTSGLVALCLFSTGSMPAHAEAEAVFVSQSQTAAQVNLAKCLSGVVGSTLLGVLPGFGFGSIPGALIGAVGGAVIGYGETCND